jgi:hypothetical protein
MKKQKRPSLRQKLNAAAGQVKTLQMRLDESDKVFQNIRRVLWGSSYYQYNRDQIIEGIEGLQSDLRQSTSTVDELRSSRDIRSYMLEQENSRLWYMVRSMTGDETLISAKRPDPTRLGGSTDIFNQAKF